MLSTRISTLCLSLLALLSAHALPGQGPPPRPEGLDEAARSTPSSAAETDPGPPPRPAGLDPAGGPPPLPEGLGAEDAASASETGEPAQAPRSWREALPFRLSGFAEARVGHRLQNDPLQRDLSMLETRLQLEAADFVGPIEWRLTADVLYDTIAVDHESIDLDSGSGWLDLREAWLRFSPVEFADIKAGRQIATWGTGDLLFLNDLFPKDFNSFFIGRDVDYLKAPSDAIRAGVFFDWANLDLVVTPKFDADRFIDGSRISFFSPASGGFAGRGSPVDPVRPSGAETALRLYGTLGRAEWAAYFYNGYWKNPQGQDAQGRPIFPELRAYGASVLRPLWGGLGNVEVSYYESRDDDEGEDPRIANSQFRALAGFERELAPNLTGAAQVYWERTLDYGALERNAPVGSTLPDEDRIVLTMRLTQLALLQDLELSLFTFYSPTDADLYARPRITYQIDDTWTVSTGANLFAGDSETTFFGQFEDASNAWVSLRASF